MSQSLAATASLMTPQHCASISLLALLGAHENIVTLHRAWLAPADAAAADADADATTPSDATATAAHLASAEPPTLGRRRS